VDGGLLPELLSRATTRRAAFVALLLFATACTSTVQPPSRPSDTSTETSSPTGEPGGPNLGNPRRAFAVWPEDNATDAAEALSGEIPAWRLDPEATARAFAARVLGWTDAVVRPDVGSIYQVTDGDGRGAIQLVIMQPAARAWSVVSMQRGGEDVDYGPSLGMQDGVLEMFGLTAERGVSMVEAYAHFGSLRGHAVADDDGAVTIRLGGPTQVAGHVLILWRDGDGNVISGFASPLPAGDTAAG